MTFSIIVVVSRGVENKDRCEVFLKCFEALCVQDFPKKDFEVVVVDSGSGLNGGGVKALEKIVEGSLVNFSFINPGLGNIGPAGARNIGIKAVSEGRTKIKPEFVAFTDDDTLVPEDWIKKLSLGFEKYPGAAGVGGLTLPAEDLVERNIFAYYDRFIYNRYSKSFGKSTDINEHPVFSGNIAYKLTTLEKVGGFDESFEPWIYGEDADLKDRVVKVGGFLVFSTVVNSHLARYTWQRFIRQQESRGAGILKFRQKHNLNQQNRLVIFLKLFATPMALVYYLAKSGGDAKIAPLEMVAYFFRQVGKLKYYDRLINCHSGQRAGIQEPGSQVKSFDTELRTAEVPGMTEIVNPIDKIKILFADHTPLVGGAQLALLRHLKYLNQKVFAPVAVVSRDCPDFNLKLETISGLGWYFLHFPHLKSLNPFSLAAFKLTCLRFFLISKKERPDIFVANTERSFYVCFLVSLLLNKKLILVIRDFEYSKILLWVTSFKVSRYICVSQKIKEFYGLPEAKSEVIYVGSDLEERLSMVKEVDTAKIRKDVSCGEGGLLIGFVGRLLEWKGPYLVLEAFAELLKKYPSLSLVYVGDGPDRNNLEVLSKSLRVSKNVYFEGFSQSVENWYKIFDIFVHASIEDEPFATTVVEAAFSGLPIVATNTGGTAEFIEDGKNGLLVKPKKESLVEALTMLITDEGLRKRFGKAALQKASLGFTEEKITKEFERVYLGVK